MRCGQDVPVVFRIVGVRKRQDGRFDDRPFVLQTKDTAVQQICSELKRINGSPAAQTRPYPLQIQEHAPGIDAQCS